jgi:VanZ family protein
MVENRLRSQFHPGWLAVALASMACLLTLTHIPNEVLPKVLQRSLLDKVEHAVAYGVIAILCLHSLRRPVRPLLLLILLLALAVVGALDEITQPLVNRHASITDYAFDLIGIAAACVIFLVRRGRGGQAKTKMQDAK